MRQHRCHLVTADGLLEFRNGFCDPAEAEVACAQKVVTGPVAGIELDRFPAVVHRFTILPQVVVKARLIVEAQRKRRINLVHDCECPQSFFAASPPT